MSEEPRDVAPIRTRISVPQAPLLTSATRALALERIRAQLMRHRFPRMQMSLIVLLAGTTGFVSSFLLLHAGVTRMAIRYPLAVGAAYAIFLGCLWLWLKRYRLRARRDEERASVLDHFDITDVPLSAVDTSAPMPSFDGFGGGGGFSGGGGGSSWGDGAARPVEISGSPDIGIDIDEGGFVVVLLTLCALLAAGAAIYIVYIAPALFAELLLDAALSAGLYRRLRDDNGSWLKHALRRTIVPALLVALALGGTGWFMQKLYPQATSIGRVLERLQARTHER